MNQTKRLGFTHHLAAGLLTVLTFLCVGAPQAAAQMNFCVDDVAGANDVNGQGDTTLFCVDETNLPASFDVDFSFDVTGLSGNNSADGCLLYDSNSNGNVDFALCVSLQGTPLTLNAGPLLFTCNDSKNDRCAGNVSQALSAGSITACSVSQQSTDPFPAGAGYPFDTITSCTIDTDDIPASGVLSNFTSFPSTNPNSNPIDSVVEPGSAFVDLTATVIPDDGTSFEFTLTDGTNTDTAIISGSGVARMAVIAGTYSLSVTVPDGWVVTSGVCLQGGTPTGTFDGIDTVTGMELTAADLVGCAFTTARAGRIIVTKTTDPSGSPTSFTFTPSYNGGLPFQLTDGQSNDSGDLAPGTYSVAEAVPAGWNLEGATCDDGSSVTSIVLEAE